MSPTQDYIAVPTPRSTDDLLELYDLSADEHERRRAASESPDTVGHPNRLIFWGTICVICSTLLSFAVTLADAVTSSRPSVPSAVPPPKMKRPNPFVNLNRILTPNATMAFDPVLNFPPMSLQIVNADPERRMHEDVRDRPTAFGTVYPDDRHIVISPKVSTIIQFRNLDYGMERCALHFEVPGPSGRFDPMVNLPEHSQAEIWILDSPTELSRYIPGALERAPKRRSVLTTFRFSAIEPTHFGTFDCPSGEFTTLELTCSPMRSPCNVDFWQDKRAKPRGGIYIIQSPSKLKEGDGVE